MTISLRIPGPLRRYTDGRSVIQVPAKTVGEALDWLLESYPVLSQHMLTRSGEIRPFINIYVGDQEFRQLNGRQTSVESGTEISIVPSIAGGL